MYRLIAHLFSTKYSSSGFTLQKRRKEPPLALPTNISCAMASLPPWSYTNRSRNVPGAPDHRSATLQSFEALISAAETGVMHSEVGIDSSYSTSGWIGLNRSKWAAWYGRLRVTRSSLVAASFERKNASTASEREASLSLQLRSLPSIFSL